jgi:hypothetical protein
LIFRQHFAITLPMPLLMIFIADIDIFIIAIIYAIIFIADILFNIIIFIIYSIISLQGFRFHFQMLNFGLMPCHTLSARRQLLFSFLRHCIQLRLPELSG